MRTVLCCVVLDNHINTHDQFSQLTVGYDSRLALCVCVFFVFS